MSRSKATTANAQVIMPQPAASATLPDWVVDVLRDVPPILRIGEVVALVRMSDRQLRRYVAEGRLHAMRSTDCGGARLLFARAEVGRFLESMQVTQ